MVKNRIHIEGIRLYGYHGCLEEESRIGAEYIIDVYIQTDFMYAAKHDDLKHTIDYCTVFEICKAEMQIRSKLIEQVAMRIYDKIKVEFTNCAHTKVKVTKVHPPISGPVDSVSVVIED